MVVERPTLAVFGAKSDDELPGLSDVRNMVEIEFATGEEELAHVLEHARILLGWDFRAGALERVWSHAGRLEWVHWAGAGVDAVLFPGLRDSNVILTNARGIFDWAIAEYVLGLVLCLAKGFPRTVLSQREKRWDFRHAESIRGKTALLVGAGNIGSAIGQLLRTAGMQVIGVARRARDDDPVFGEVHALAALDSLLESVDYVVNVTPSTPATRGLFSAQRLRLLKPDARFINVGRGDAVDENALAAVLSTGRIAGAALDVFADEPLPDSSPLWELDNLIISPHMSGDVKGADAALIAQFADNLGRFLRGEPLENVVDKRKGY